MKLTLGNMKLTFKFTQSCPPCCGLPQSSPPSLCAAGRTSDLDAILSVIQDADEFVYIAVMSYVPMMEFSRPKR